MKKNTVFIAVFLTVITIAAYSQINKNVASSESIKFIYCELYQQDRLYLGKYQSELFLKFGSKSIYPDRTEESNYIRVQTDGLDGLNYMIANEWELAFKNVREFGTAGIETVYLLRKKVR